MSTDLASFPALVGALNRRGVRFVLIGVWGANFHARDASALFTTLDTTCSSRPLPTISWKPGVRATRSACLSKPLESPSMSRGTAPLPRR